MSNWRERLSQFMQGRYGANDTLNKWLFGAFLIVLLLSMLVQSSILNVLSLAILAYAYFRIFSRNIERRSAENQKFLGWKQSVVRFFRRDGSGVAHDKSHHVYACPQCRQKVRVPKGRGKICITCPKCHNEFIKRS